MSSDQEHEVRIQEPAFQEIKKKTSCFKRACINGCGCLVLLLIGSFIFLRLFASPHQKTLSSLPSHIERSIPIYDTENVEKIILESGSEKEKKWQQITVIPKLILSPLVISQPSFFLESDAFTPTSTKKEIFTTFLQTPLLPRRDTYILTWSHLSTDPDFVFSFYQNELEQQGYTITSKSQTTSVRELGFLRENSFGILKIKDSPEETGTDQVTLIFSIHPSDTL